MARHWTPPHSDRWTTGLRVTLVISGKEITGTVIRLPRKSDGQYFTMVDIDATGDNGAKSRRVWPDGWVLGAGPFKRVCLGCEQPYRTKDDLSDFCPQCDKADGVVERDGMSQGHTRALLRGNATKTRTSKAQTPEEAQQAREIAAIKQADEAESIF